MTSNFAAQFGSSIDVLPVYQEITELLYIFHQWDKEMMEKLPK